MTSPTIDPQTMTRLAFIRLLDQQGVDQTRLPEPLTFTSVLSFHDAVEHLGDPPSPVPEPVAALLLE